MDGFWGVVLGVVATLATTSAQQLLTGRQRTRELERADIRAMRDWNREDVKAAHAALYGKLQGRLRMAAGPSRPIEIDGRMYEQPGREAWETGLEFDVELVEVELVASEDAVAAGLKAIAHIALLFELSGDEMEGDTVLFRNAEKAIDEYRDAIRKDRGLG